MRPKQRRGLQLSKKKRIHKYISFRHFNLFLFICWVLVWIVLCEEREKKKLIYFFDSVCKRARASVCVCVCGERTSSTRRWSSVVNRRICCFSNWALYTLFLFLFSKMRERRQRIYQFKSFKYFVVVVVVSLMS